MTPTLPEALATLSTLLPERIPFARDHVCVVFLHGSKTPVAYHSPRDLDVIEMALREECEARGWTWSVDCITGPRFSAGVLPRPAVWSYNTAGETPALALCLALTAALTAQPAPTERELWTESKFDVTGAEQ